MSYALSPAVTPEKYTYSPYETVRVTATVKNKWTWDLSVRLELRYEPWPLDPMHQQSQLFAAKVGYIGGFQTVTFEGEFDMPPAGVEQMVVGLYTWIEENRDGNLVWTPDNTDVKVLQVRASTTPPATECDSGDFYCLTESPGDNDSMVCVNGEWERRSNDPRCYVDPGPQPGDSGCTGTTLWWIDEDGLSHHEYNSLECGGTGVDGNGAEPPPADDLTEQIVKYTAIGALVFAAAMLLIPSKKGQGLTSSEGAEYD